MKAFFRGWKRKAGVVILGIASAFMVGWIRSEVDADFVGLLPGDATYYVLSHDGLLDFEISRPSPPIEKPVGRSDDSRFTTTVAVTVPLTTNRSSLIWGSLKLLWFHQNFGIRVGNIDVFWKEFDVERQLSLGRFQLMGGNDGSRHVRKLVVPYWPIVIPLTLLSAYLLLSKPKESQSVWPTELKVAEVGNAAVRSFISTI